MKNSIITYFILSFTLIFSGCTFIFDCVEGSGTIISENRTVYASFNKITNEIGGNVYVQQGNTHSITIVAQSNIIDEISTNVHNGELKIGFKQCVNSHKDINIYITTPEISALHLSGSGNMIGENTFYSDYLDLNISGSGLIDIDFEANEAYVEVSGSGSVFMTGISPKFQTHIAGSGSINAFGLEAQVCEAQISGSGSIEVTAFQKLNAKIEGSGSVFYKGYPVITKIINGSGNVQNAN